MGIVRCRARATALFLLFLATGAITCSDPQDGLHGRPDATDAADQLADQAGEVSDLVDLEGNDGPDDPDRDEATGDPTTDDRADLGDGADHPDSIDLDQDLGSPSIPVPIELTLDDAMVSGDVPLLLDTEGNAYRLLSMGGTIAWDVVLSEPGTALLEVHASLWRQEAARLVLSSAGRMVTATLLQAHAVPHWLSLFQPESQPRERGAGVDFDPDPLVLSLPAGNGRIELALEDPAGHLQLYGCRLVPLSQEVLRPLEEGVVATLDPSGTAVPVSPCAQTDCDDSQQILQALQSIEGPVIVQLEPGTYTFRSPLAVRRSQVMVMGAGRDATEILWDPAPSTGDWARAILFAGQGPTGEYLLVTEPVAAETRSLVLPADAPIEVGMTIHLTSDDFGEVPPLCVGGRDVERQVRHVNWMGRVVEIQDGELGRVLWLDRHIGYNLPLEARPRVAPVHLVEGIGLASLTLKAACPEAEQLQPYTQLHADCTNPQVLDHSAVSFQWARGGLVRDVEVNWFGRFAVEVLTSLDTRVYGGRMARPADYGSGGKGYGVHAIRSSRTFIQQYEVEQARHAVVFDFGSTESQVVDSDFSTLSLAAVDVHGEASYDSLILANRITDSVQGIIVGGGGREEHCNDGPRHHAVLNQITGSTVAGVWLTDYSSQVTLEQNTIRRSYTSVYIDAGTSQVWLYRNHLLEASSPHLWIREPGQGTGPIRLTHNLMDGSPPGYWSEPGIEVVVEETWFED